MPLDLPRAHRVDWRGALGRLDPRLLIHAQHQRALGGREVEAGDVAHLLDELPALRELERLGAVRLQPKRARSDSPPSATARRASPSAGCSGASPVPAPSPASGAPSRRPPRPTRRIGPAGSIGSAPCSPWRAADTLRSAPSMSGFPGFRPRDRRACVRGTAPKSRSATNRQAFSACAPAGWRVGPFARPSLRQRERSRTTYAYLVAARVVAVGECTRRGHPAARGVSVIHPSIAPVPRLGLRRWYASRRPRPVRRAPLTLATRAPLTLGTTHANT